jgi:hypothetical protein
VAVLVEALGYGTCLVFLVAIGLGGRHVWILTPSLFGVDATTMMATPTIQVRLTGRASLEIPAGTSLAIVGQNGAGKTTLAKLLCRLYDPQSGAIEVDGVDLRDLDLESWRRRVTAVFQDFVPVQADAARKRGARAGRRPRRRRRGPRLHHRRRACRGGRDGPRGPGHGARQGVCGRH